MAQKIAEGKKLQDHGVQHSFAVLLGVKSHRLFHTESRQSHGRIGVPALLDYSSKVGQHLEQSNIKDVVSGSFYGYVFLMAYGI